MGQGNAPVKEAVTDFDPPKVGNVQVAVEVSLPVCIFSAGSDRPIKPIYRLREIGKINSTGPSFNTVVQSVISQGF